MKSIRTPRIKICCISSVNEAKLAIQYGAAALGLVGNMPSGPGVIDDDLIANISSSVPPPIATFLLTSETEAASIIAHHKKVETNTIQIVDKVEIAVYEKLRKFLPSIKIVQVIHVIDERSIEEAFQVSRYVDAVLLDSGNPNLEIKELGGTGRVHNWDLSRKIRKELNIPIFLAGGIGPHNIADAVKIVGPFGIDLCSSVRTNEKLDEIKLKALFEEINRD